MSLVAIPMYIWARRLVSPVYAVLAAVLVLLMPIFVYVNEVMTENLAFPVFVSALFADRTRALASSLSPGRRSRLPRSCWRARHGSKRSCCSSCCRLQSCSRCCSMLARRPPGRWAATCCGRSLAYALTFVLLIAGATPTRATRPSRAGSVRDLSASTRGIETAGYRLEGVARWTALHFAELSIRSA